MRRARGGVSVLLLVLALARGADGQPLTHDAPPVSGRVVDAITGSPVAGAAILVYWPGVHAAPPFFFDTLAVREAVSDAEGRFAIPAWRSGTLPSPPERAEPRLWVLAPGYGVANVGVGWSGGEALRVPLDFPRAADVAARDLVFVAASLGFLAASLDGDAPPAFLGAVEREWQALPPEEQKGQTSVTPLFEHASSEGRGLIAEWRYAGAQASVAARSACGPGAIVSAPTRSQEGRHD